MVIAQFGRCLHGVDWVSVRARTVKNWLRPIASSFGPVIGRVVDVPRFSERVEVELRAAGWLPGRAVDVDFWRRRLVADGMIGMHAAAAGFLSEFGGLRLDLDGPGVTMARAPVNFNPLRGAESRSGSLNGVKKWDVPFPIGSLESERFCLGMSEAGEIFLVEAWLASFGVGDVAVENLILGVMPVTLDND